MTEKQKILLYLETKGITKNKFYMETGLSIGFLDRGKSLGVDNLRIIINKYPDLNLEWIVTGEGPMLKTETPTSAPMAAEVDPQEVAELKEQLRIQTETINRLTETNNRLTENYLELSHRLISHALPVCVTPGMLVTDSFTECSEGGILDSQESERELSNTTEETRPKKPSK